MKKIKKSVESDAAFSAEVERFVRSVRVSVASRQPSEKRGGAAASTILLAGGG